MDNSEKIEFEAAIKVREDALKKCILELEKAALWIGRMHDNIPVDDASCILYREWEAMMVDRSTYLVIAQARQALNASKGFHG